MSEFVNYNKRSVSLPPGCKNLIDILQQTQWSYTTDPGKHKNGGKTEETTGKVSEIRKYVNLVLKAPLQLYGLEICPRSGYPVVDIHLLPPNNVVVVTVSARHDTPEELAVREFFIRNDLELPSAAEIALAVAFPDLPYDNQFRIHDPPSNPAMLAQIITDLFKECCSTDEDSELVFRVFPNHDVSV